MEIGTTQLVDRPRLVEATNKITRNRSINQVNF